MSAWFDRYGFAQIDERLLIGAYPQDARDVQTLSAAGVTCVLNLVEDHEYEPDSRAACTVALARAGIPEFRMELVDQAGFEVHQLNRAVQLLISRVQAGERVYLHCRAGWQRSSAVAAAALALLDAVSPLETLERIRDCRRDAVPLPQQREDMAEWWRTLHGDRPHERVETGTWAGKRDPARRSRPDGYGLASQPWSVLARVHNFLASSPALPGGDPEARAGLSASWSTHRCDRLRPR